MTFLKHLLHHPRKLWIRKAAFQMHLWGGVFLALYLVVIALTGSVLVFEQEFTRTTLPASLLRHQGMVGLSIPQAVLAAQHQYPTFHLEGIQTPSPEIPAYLLQATNAEGREFELAIDPHSGEVFSLGRTWVQWVRELHVNLLLNKRYGRQVNAVGALILLMLTVTGAFLWWPGVRSWARGLRINLRANWRRITYDSHAAIGIWTLGIIFWWALSGTYFGFYLPIAAALNAVSPVQSMRPPQTLPAAHSALRVSLDAVVQAAQKASPQGHLSSVSNVALRDQVTFALVDLRAPGDFTHRDIVRIDTSNASVLSVWHYSEKRSFSDWILWLMHPLHFGNVWGMAMKIVWFVLGLALALLSITGLLMYWNRFLRKRFSTQS